MFCLVLLTGMQLEYTSQEFEALKNDETIKFPEKHMLSTLRRKECYQGCFSKWQKQRALHEWDSFVEVAPALSKTCTEIPNYFRIALNIPTRKWNGSKFGRNDGMHFIPDPLALAIEGILIDAMTTGQEIGMNFLMKTMSYMVNLWNDHIKDIRDHIEKAVKDQIDAGNHVESCRPLVRITDNQGSQPDHMKKLFDILQFCNIKDNLENRRLLAYFLILPSFLCVFAV